MSKLMEEAKKLIISYDNQGWETQGLEYDYDNNSSTLDMKHKNGNKMKLYLDYHAKTISVYINYKLKDQIKLK